MSVIEFGLSYGWCSDFMKM